MRGGNVSDREELPELHRHSRDQSLRAALSIPRNIAEGDGKRSLKDSARFFDFSRGSALECSAIQEMLLATEAISTATNDPMKAKLKRIEALWTRLQRVRTVSQNMTQHSITSTSTSTSGCHVNSRLDRTLVDRTVLTAVRADFGM